MSTSVANVHVGKPLATGGILIGARGTTLPTSATDAIDPALEATGYVGEDGLTETLDRQTNKIKAWGGDVVKVVQTEFGCTYKFKMIESSNAVALKAMYGEENVSVVGGTVAIAINGDELPHNAYVFLMKDGDAKIVITVEDGQITETGDIEYKDDDVIAYDVTVEAFPGADGNNAHKYLDNGVEAPDPVIGALSPATSAAAGGALIILTGANLTGATAVTIGGTPLSTSAWELVSDSVISLITPAHAAGSVNVTVTTPAGTSNTKALVYS